MLSYISSLSRIVTDAADLETIVPDAHELANIVKDDADLETLDPSESATTLSAPQVCDNWGGTSNFESEDGAGKKKEKRPRLDN